MSTYLSPAHRRRSWLAVLALALTTMAISSTAATTLNASTISKAAGVEATVQPDGVVKIGWSRNDVPATVDGMHLSPA